MNNIIAVIMFLALLSQDWSRAAEVTTLSLIEKDDDPTWAIMATEQAKHSLGTFIFGNIQ